MSNQSDLFVTIRSSESPTVTTFLHEGDQQLITRMFKQNDYNLEGGYEGAVRKRAYLFTSPQDDIRLLQVIADTRYHELTHQSILGGLLGSGIEYDQIGDILPHQGIIVVTKEVYKHIRYNITHIGNAPVTFERVTGADIHPEQAYLEFEGIVDSMRLDLLVKCIASTSRKDAKTMIEKELVKRNHEVDTKATRTVEEQDVLSIRHHGRFIVDDTTGRTRKNKIIVKYRKFV